MNKELLDITLRRLLFPSIVLLEFLLILELIL